MVILLTEGKEIVRLGKCCGISHCNFKWNHKKNVTFKGTGEGNYISKKDK